MDETTVLALQIGRRTQIMGSGPAFVDDAIDILANAWRRNAALFLMVAFALATLAISFTGLAIDHRQVGGELVWIKPCKFGISIALYGASLSFMQDYLQSGKKLFRITTLAALAGSVLELTAITLQAFRGVANHLSSASPMDSILWYMVKTAIMPVSLAVLVMCVLLMRQKHLPAVFGLSLRLGTLLAIVGLVPAVILISGQGGASGMAPGLPLIGWSTVAGDLRVAHFVGLHALQVVPLFAWFVNLRLRSLSLNRKLALVYNFGVSYCLWIVLLTCQAMHAESIVHPGQATIVAYGLLALSSLMAGFVTLRPALVVSPKTV